MRTFFLQSRDFSDYTRQKKTSEVSQQFSIWLNSSADFADYAHLPWRAVPGEKVLKNLLNLRHLRIRFFIMRITGSFAVLWRFGVQNKKRAFGNSEQPRIKAMKGTWKEIGFIPFICDFTEKNFSYREGRKEREENSKPL
jgi:hypothetical protein